MSFIDSFEPLEIPNLNLVRLPEIKLTDSEFALVDKKVNGNIEFFKQLINKGWVDFRGKVPKEKWPIYLARIREEFEIIDDLGFIDYFLLVWRVVNKAYELGAFMDWGRGSAAGSLIFFLLKVTGVDPIDKGLFFSRFVSRARAKKEVIDGITYIQGDLAPDVDLNLGGVRQEIIEWLNQQYPGRISKISALSTFSGKILIKDVLKVVEEANEDQAQDAAELIGKKFGVVNDIYDLYHGKKDDNGDWDIEPSEKWIDWVEEHKKVYDIALKLRGLIRAKTTHASGYFISNDELNNIAPLELNKEGDLALSFDMGNAAKIGIKLDLLGLTSNSIIKDIFEHIPEKIEDIELDTNPIVYEQFQTGKLLPYGLYQISADCAYGVCRHIKPANIIELSDVNAIARPGALQYQEAYVNNLGESPHPIFDEVLSWTRYQPLYQEQTMAMAQKLGFTAEESEILRRIIGKKKREEMPVWKEKITAKCLENGIDPKAGEEFWKLAEASADYSFNFSHSISVAYLGALTVYLKYKYPLEYYCACLRSANNLAEPLAEIALINKELSHFNIKLLPPNLIKSSLDFQPENGNIRFGLSSIKGISTAAMEKLVKFRDKETVSHIDCFLNAKESGLSIGIVVGLIQAGALDEFHWGSRSRIALQAQTFNILTEKEKGLVKQLYDTREETDVLNAVKSLADKGLIKTSRMETIKKKCANYKEVYLANKDEEAIVSYCMEKNFVGYSFSHTLVDLFQAKNKNICDIRNFGQNKILVAHVAEIRKSKTKKEGKQYYKFSLEDSSGAITAMLFENSFEANPNFLEIKEGDIITLKGKKTQDGGAIFIDSIVKQKYKAVLRVKDIK